MEKLDTLLILNNQRVILEVLRHLSPRDVPQESIEATRNRILELRREIDKSRIADTEDGGW
jgi:hypothetical protein